MTRPLRVVARVHAYPPTHNAGAEWTLHELLRALAARGHRPEVWLSQWTPDEDPYDVDGVHVIPAAAAGTRFPRAAARADALVSHLECVPETACLARGHGRPLVVLAHNTFELTWEPLIAGTVALAVYNSEWMRTAAGERLAGAPRRPDRELVVRPPVHPGDYRVRRGGGRHITLINSTLSKGAGVLGELAARMPQRRFLAVRGGYGEQVPPDAANVEVVDQVPGRDLPAAVYARTRILIMPSDYESWGRAGVEAMASGIPVIAHPTEGLKESLGDAGLFCDRGDIGAWHKAIEQLDDPAVYRAASARARARSTQLDPTAELDTWCRTVEEVCGARTAAR
ncbi:glycosyltransferase family 4 protein [Streptomyces synnematoformans]|uniref:Glycosyl transferase family 1 domain-containing protein n=1 Tax=Streptomyces synnematoformans TaxID=415721 RepID=A0ABP5J0M3_9ACTN